jgi:hypothetical protein
MTLGITTLSITTLNIVGLIAKHSEAFITRVLSGIKISVIKLSVVMLKLSNAECRYDQYLYAESHYAVSLY